ncbi:hypothetical protein HDU86_005547 [Geranomyces michiganensis]|nr:hypothetical protein HDU86_005547 [Geranomyces michiganensis]
MPGGATESYLGSNNTDINVANMWTGAGQILNTGDHMAVAFDQPAPRPDRKQMAAVYAEDEVLSMEGLSRADREKRIRHLRDGMIKRMALEHELRRPGSSTVHNRTVDKVFQRGTAAASIESSKCPACGKKRGRNLARHMMTHENKKQRARAHVCECGSGCFTASDLARHERRYTGLMTARQRKIMKEAESAAADDEVDGETIEVVKLCT